MSFESNFESEALDKLSAELIKELLQSHKEDVDKNDKKPALKKKAIALGYRLGEEVLRPVFTNGEIARKILSDIEGEAVKTREIEKLTKQCQKHYDDLDREKFLGKLTRSALEALCDGLGFQEPSTATSDELTNAISEEMLIGGLASALSLMNKEYLEEVVTALELKKTGSKDSLIGRIIGLGFEENTEVEEEVGAKKKPIEKGVTALDLHQYYLSELQEYAEKNGLRRTGSKKDICTRIIKFLAGDVEGTRELKKGETVKGLKKKKLKALAEKRKKKTSDEPADTATTSASTTPVKSRKGRTRT